jgi:Domain of unknown function (DUF4189)
MHDRIILGVMALAVILAATGPSAAAGAVAVGLPADVAKQGVSMGVSTKAHTMDEAKTQAITNCKTVGSPETKALCKVVATFSNQCAALAEDPKPGTPGFGWAIADTPQAAKDQAMANCRDTAGPKRRDACESGDNDTKCDGTAK